jgi:hypothetical protein
MAMAPHAGAQDCSGRQIIWNLLCFASSAVGEAISEDRATEGEVWPSEPLPLLSCGYVACVSETLLPRGDAR